MWDMLVDLFINTLEGREVSVSSLALASGAPATTALRYICILEQQRHLVRHPHPLDRRVTHLRLSAFTFSKLKEYFVTVHADRRCNANLSVDPSDFKRPMVKMDTTILDAE